MDRGDIMIQLLIACFIAMTLSIVLLGIIVITWVAKRLVG